MIRAEEAKKQMLEKSILESSKQKRIGGSSSSGANGKEVCTKQAFGSRFRGNEVLGQGDQGEAADGGDDADKAAMDQFINKGTGTRGSHMISWPGQE